MPSPTPNLWTVLSEAWRVLAVKPGHFLALWALFLLPNSFAGFAYLFLSQPTSVQTPPNPQTHLPVSILWILLGRLLSLCATCSITYTAFAAFYNKPLPFLLSLKPIVASFFPLLATIFLTEIIFFSILFAFGVLMFVAYYGLPLLGVEMDYGSPWFVVFAVLASVVLVIVVLYLTVKWCLSNAVVVLESGWGFEPLRRSSYLVMGMEKVALSMMVIFACISIPLTVWYSKVVASVGGGSGGWVLVEMGVYVVLSSMLSLYGLVATTVLFVYCNKDKAPLGHDDQLAVKINDVETGGQYAVLRIV